MKKIHLLLVLFIILLVPAVIVSTQEDDPAPTIEISGIDASDLPTARITVNVFDTLGLPVAGLTAENFRLGGPLADVSEIISVESVVDDDLPIAAVLMIDNSSSMEGFPITQAREAAKAFVNALGENDQVALYTFSTRVRLIQDYTSDSDVLINAIDNIFAVGQTALYEAGVRSVEAAAAAPFERRAVILLSDGGEFGEVSNAQRGDALRQAGLAGVPVYTIGLGFGTDRTYLETLADGTNARFVESPTADELPAIYDELARLLRSQYIITLNADIPFDGTEYAFTLQADTPEGETTLTAGTLRAPIPVPIVTATGVPDGPIDTETTISLDIAADDDITEVSSSLTAADGTVITENPFAATDAGFSTVIRPETLNPGNYALDVSVTDSSGDVVPLNIPLTIAQLTTAISISPDLTDATIEEPVTLTIDQATDLGYTGQLVITEGSISLAEDTLTFTEIPFEAEIDPMGLPPGDLTLIVSVTNAGGTTSQTLQPITIAALPPTFTITDISGTYSDSFIPGEALTVDVTLGESQTPVSEITATIAGREPFATITEFEGDTITLTLPDFVELGTGDFVLEVTVVNEGGGSATQSTNFTVDVLPTPTPTFTPSPTLTPTHTPTSTPTPTPTIDIQGTADAQATLDTQSTAMVEAGIAIDATNTADAQAALDAQATADAQSTAQADATATQIANSTALAESRATLSMENTATAIANATNTAIAQSTMDANATADAQSTLDAIAAATTQAELTEEANAQATLDADATITAQAELTEEANAQATADAQATQDIENETATASANSTALADSRATLSAENTATAIAQAMINADASATAAAESDREAETATAIIQQATQDTLDMTATAQAEITEEVDATATAAEIASIARQATADAITDTPQPTNTIAPTATSEPTNTIEPTEAPMEEVTEEVTEEATPEITEEPTTTIEPTETETPTEEVTEEATPEITEAPTLAPDIDSSDPTPVGDLAEVEAQGADEDESTDFLPLILIAGGLLLLIILFFLLSRRRDDSESTT